MLNIDIIKSNELEVTDSVVEERRKFYVQVYRYGYITALIVLLIGFFVISFNWLGYAIVVLGLFFALTVVETNKIGRIIVLQEELAGIKFVFDESQKLEQIFTINFLPKSYTEFTEKEIRFTQALGFRIYTYDVLQHPSILKQKLQPGYFLGFVVEITYDTAIRGIDIFRSADENSAAEFLKLLQSILPRKKIMVYSLIEQEKYPQQLFKLDVTDFQNMNATDLALLQASLENAIVPRDIREFLK